MFLRTTLAQFFSARTGTMMFTQMMTEVRHLDEVVTESKAEVRIQLSQHPACERSSSRDIDRIRPRNWLSISAHIGSLDQVARRPQMPRRSERMASSLQRLSQAFQGVAVSWPCVPRDACQITLVFCDANKTVAAVLILRY